MRIAAETGRMCGCLTRTVAEMWDYLCRGRLPFRLTSLFAQTERAGVESVPLVAMVSFFLGLTMALLTGYQLATFGQEQLVPGLVAIAFTRELGPLITGIVIAARIGAAYTAELGTMVVNEEVEAIDAMGIGPYRFLMAPRVVAITFLLPSLSVVSCVAAIFGAYLISMSYFNIAQSYFIDLVMSSILLKDVVTGIFKSIFFGLIIGIVACYKGMGVRGGAAGVGLATTSSVVTAITAVIAFDTLFNVFMVVFFP